MVQKNPPMNPSQVFLGLSMMRGVRPKKNPEPPYVKGWGQGRIRRY